MLTKLQKGSNTYAVYEEKCDLSDLDNVSIQMINSNQKLNIGLAPIMYDAMNDECEKIMFDVTGRVNLNDYLSSKMDQNTFKNILLNIINTIEGFDEYMIEVGQIMLDIDCVFINEVTKSIMFLCLPVKGKNTEIKLFEFFKKILETSDVEWDVNQYNFFGPVYNVVKNEGSFSLENVKTALEPANTQLQDEKESPESSNMTQEPELVAESVIPVQNTVIIENTHVDEPAENIQIPQLTNMKKQDQKKGLFGKLFDKKKEPKVKEPKVKEPKANSKGKDDGPVEAKGLAALKKGSSKKDDKKGGIKVPNLVPPTSTPMSVPQVPVQPVPSPQTPLQQPVQIQPPVMPIPPIQQPQQQPVSNYNAQPVPDNRNSQPDGNNINPYNVLNSQPVANQQPSEPVSAPATDWVTSAPAPAPQPQRSRIEPPPRPAPVARPAQQNDNDYVGTTVLNNPFANSSPETTVLKSNQTANAYLVRMKDRQSIQITSTTFSIGRDRNDQSLCINDNTAIGHKHACIIRKGSKFYVIDNDSINHTYINDIMIEPNFEFEIKNRDKITFADEDFEFSII